MQAASQGEVQRSINTLYPFVMATVSLTVLAVLELGVISTQTSSWGWNP